MKCLIFVLVFLCLGSAVNCKPRRRPQLLRTPPPPPIGLGGFDVYFLVFQYPLSLCTSRKTIEVCRDTDIAKIPRDFVLHGLWPQRSDDQELVASSEVFNLTEITPLFKRLIKSWPDQTRNKLGMAAWSLFWKHEWEEHGTRSGLGQKEYFTLALDLYERAYNLFNPLKLSNTAGAGINITQLAEEFQSLSKPLVVCNTNYYNTREQLWELRFTVSRTDGSFLPPTDRSGCSTDVVYLPS